MCDVIHCVLNYLQIAACARTEVGLEFEQ
jgi:hypothetical protein